MNGNISPPKQFDQLQLHPQQALSLLPTFRFEGVRVFTNKSF